MRNLVSIIVILLIIAGTATAADYWHFGLGLRGTGVLPGGDHKSALGVGIIGSFGDPDSKFNTRIEVDSWKVTYDYDGADANLVGKEHQYSGLGFGLYEKYRLFDTSKWYSPYVIGGAGAYFLELKREEDTDILGTQLRSQYIHSLFMASAGLGLEARISGRLTGFLEGRFVAVSGESGTDNNLIQTYLGAAYSF